MCLTSPYIWHSKVSPCLPLCWGFACLWVSQGPSRSLTPSVNIWWAKFVCPTRPDIQSYVRNQRWSLELRRKNSVDWNKVHIWDFDAVGGCWRSSASQAHHKHIKYHDFHMIFHDLPYVCKHNCWPPNTFALANHAFILTLGCRSSEVQSLALENYAKSIQYIIVYGPWFGIQRPINYNSNTQSSKDSWNLLHEIQLQKSNWFREIHDAVQKHHQVSETNLCNLEATCLMFRLDSGNKSINKWSKNCLRPLRLWPL